MSVALLPRPQPQMNSPFRSTNLDGLYHETHKTYYFVRFYFMTNFFSNISRKSILPNMIRAINNTNQCYVSNCMRDMFSISYWIRGQIWILGMSSIWLEISVSIMHRYNLNCINSNCVVTASLKIFDRIHCSMSCLLLHFTMTLLLSGHERPLDGLRWCAAQERIHSNKMGDNKCVKFEFSDKNEKKWSSISMYRCITKILFDNQIKKVFRFDDIPNEDWIAHVCFCYNNS